MLIRTCLLVAFGVSSACSRQEPTPSSPPSAPTTHQTTTPPVDPNNIVNIAIHSPDHRTLVAALRAANYVTSVANPGPLTVFAPTDAAFGKLPPGTVDDLVRPEKQADLREILKYHVAPAVYEAAALRDGMELGMANGKKVKFRVADGKTEINGAKILASVRASNGIVHVIDGVLLPPDD